MAWNTEGKAPESKTHVKCNGNNYDITGINGLGLVEKLKAIARDNGISMFDIYNGENTNLSPSDIENGNFISDQSLAWFNVAA